MSDFDFAVIGQNLPFLAKGLGLSLWLTFLVVIGGMILGAGLALMRLSSFTLFEAAYYAEILRAGIQSVRSGQVQAGKASGLNYWQIQRYIVLPQAFRNMIPILLTQRIVLFQDTSLVFVVSLRDFMTSASIVARTEGCLVEMYVFVAAVYFVLCFSGSFAVRRLQKGRSR
ncbi:amino acid ABC transporter permease [Breoghania sp.]|uniref:amino acid ABC transporter permease n=1 Tax=Breoghania sp. TaxID=2065378 RepID=UPI0026277378|nr:amino acid ABC transporter permease [Breoghania sp.]MDJ0930582.1 amino acid ABC transporter permease [Breoghania sp.]